jgi:hypothetical protein
LRKYSADGGFALGALGEEALGEGVAFDIFFDEVEEVVFAEVGVEAGDLGVIAKVFEYGCFTLEAFFDEGVDFGVIVEGFELFEYALAIGGHLVIAYQEGFAEATVTEFSEDFVAIVEVVGCLHGGWFLVQMDYGAWFLGSLGITTRGFGFVRKGGVFLLYRSSIE